MSDTTDTAEIRGHLPQVTASAKGLLDGRAVHVRGSRRHGCCGGAAVLPVAEPGVPESLVGAERFEVSGIDIYVDRALLPTSSPWTIDTDGFGRWRRLTVLGLGLAPA